MGLEQPASPDNPVTRCLNPPFDASSMEPIKRALGTLDVLRHGVEMIGLKQKLPPAQFRPALAMNSEILTRYGANQLRAG